MKKVNRYALWLFVLFLHSTLVCYELRRLAIHPEVAAETFGVPHAKLLHNVIIRT